MKSKYLVLFLIVAFLMVPLFSSCDTADDPVDDPVDEPVDERETGDSVIESPHQSYGPSHLGLAITPDGTMAYIPFSLDDGVLVVELDTFTVVDAIDVSSAGIQLLSSYALLSFDGKKLYVSNPGPQNIMVIDTSSNQLETVLPIPPLHHSAFGVSADGSKIYVPGQDGSLYVIDTIDNSYENIFIGGVLFGPIAVSKKDPNLLFTAGAFIDQNVRKTAFFSFDLNNESIEKIIYLEENVIGEYYQAVKLVLSTNESKAYFGTFNRDHGDRASGNLVVIDLNRFEIEASITADYGVADFVANEHLNRIYVVGFWSGGGAQDVPILEFDLNLNQFVRSIPLSPSNDMRAIALDSVNPDYLYQTSGDHNVLRKIEISTGQVVNQVQFNKNTIKPYMIISDGNVGYIICFSQTMYKLDLSAGEIIGTLDIPVMEPCAGFHEDKLYFTSRNNIMAVNPDEGTVIQDYDIGQDLYMMHFLTFFNEKMAVIEFQPHSSISNNLLIFDSNTMHLKKAIPLPKESCGHMAVASPDGSKLYVSNGQMFGQPTLITIIDGIDLEIIKTIEIPPAHLRHGSTNFVNGVFDEENRFLYLLGFTSVYKIHMDTDELLESLDLIDIFEVWGRDGWSPTGLAALAFSYDRKRLFVVSGDVHTLYSYNIAESNWETTSTNIKGYFTTHGVVSQDRQYFYTVNHKSDNITMICLHTGEVIKVIDLHD